VGRWELEDKVAVGRWTTLRSVAPGAPHCGTARREFHPSRDSHRALQPFLTALTIGIEPGEAP